MQSSEFEVSKASEAIIAGLTLPNGIGNVNSNEIGSGARFNTGKIRYELIPTHLLESTAKVFEHGAKKYSMWNWCKPGMKSSTIIGCMKRHIAEIERGEDFDNCDGGSGERHVGHLLCNALMGVHHFSTDFDDRPSKWFLNPR